MNKGEEPRCQGVNLIQPPSPLLCSGKGAGGSQVQSTTSGTFCRFFRGTGYSSPMMSKLSSIPFVALVAFLNLVCNALLLARYIGCNDQPGCIGPGTTIIASILNFPLDLVSWLWQTPNQPIPKWAFVLGILNAVLFGYIVWFALSWLLKRRGNPG